jgi:phosphomannomutase
VRFVESHPIIIDPSFKNYAWGESSFIPALFGLADASSPYAEAWFGAHPLSPSLAHIDGEKLPLDQLIAESPHEVLGSHAAARFSTLPFLLKILAASQPLSIQAHPSRAQAISGFRKESAAGIPLVSALRNYRDSSPKPEAIFALTAFEALCGFRPIGDIKRDITAAPEFTGLFPAWEQSAEPLRMLLKSYFELPENTVQAALDRWITRLGNSSPGTDTIERRIIDASRIYSAGEKLDRGLLFFLLLNFIKLNPGEGLFVSTGTPHAYLRGAVIEVMSSSDNVIRAGLTPKNIEAREFMSIVRFESRPPYLLKPSAEAVDEIAYPTPAEEFEISRMQVGGDRPSRERISDGPELLLFLAPDSQSTLCVKSPGRQVKLSNAGCCLVPHGIRYGLDADRAGDVFRVRIPAERPVGEFRGRRVRPLSFGTSGLRGLVVDITDLEAYVNTRGFLDYLVEIGDVILGSPVAVAGDLRPSTDGILSSVVRAVTDAGFSPVYCGKIPTPALASYAFEKGWPSIMVTGSHIPFDRNGIKFNKSHGEVLKVDEQGILQAVARVRRAEFFLPAEQSLFDDNGKLDIMALPTLPPPSPEAKDAYIRRYLDFLPHGALSGMRCLVYEHTAVGRDIVADLLNSLGATVHRTGRTNEFVPIDTEAISDAKLAELQSLADQTRAQYGPIDAIVSTDGDSDRPMIVTLTASGGANFHAGDLLGIAVADYLRADVLAVPVTATDAVDQHFADRSVRVIRTRVGSPWVIAGISEESGLRKVAWEANGGFLTFSEIERNGRRLKPLPTRDALLPLLAVLHLAKERGTSVNGVFLGLPRRFTKAGLIDSDAQGVTQALMTKYGLDFGLEEVSFFREGWGVQTAGGKMEEISEVLRRKLSALRDELARHFNAGSGFDSIVSVNFIDGIKIKFENGDTAHIRSSGNAPQIRIYAVASSEERANKIVGLAVRQPDGILQSIIKSVFGKDLAGSM